MDIEAMQDFFNKTPVQLPKALSYKEKTNYYYIILEVIGIWKKMRASTPKETKTGQKTTRERGWN